MSAFLELRMYVSISKLSEDWALSVHCPPLLDNLPRDGADERPAGAGTRRRAWMS